MRPWSPSRAPRRGGVRDEGSRNGTFLNGERVNSEPSVRCGLVDQDVLRVGATLIIFESVELEPDATLVVHAEPPLLGSSVALSRLRGEIGRIAERTMTVLIEGESGSGKELVAQR